MKKNYAMYLTFIGLLSACGPQNEEAFTSNSSISSGNDLAPSKWSNPSAAFPLQLSMSSDFDATEVAAIQSVADEWSISTKSSSQFFDTTNYISEKSSGDLNSYNDGEMGVYKLTAWPGALPPTALAVTQIFGMRKNAGTTYEFIEIQHADILVNYQNFSFTSSGGFGYDLQTVMLHEMGHFLGLYHDESSIDESVMYPTISRFTDNRVPKERDINNIDTKYATTVSAAGAVRFMASVSPTEQPSVTIVPDEKVVIRFEIFPEGKENIVVKTIK